MKQPILTALAVIAALFIYDNPCLVFFLLWFGTGALSMALLIESEGRPYGAGQWFLLSMLTLFGPVSLFAVFLSAPDTRGLFLGYVASRFTKLFPNKKIVFQWPVRVVAKNRDEECPF